jgi:hypothetical protein
MYHAGKSLSCELRFDFSLIYRMRRLYVVNWFVALDI